VFSLDDARDAQVDLGEVVHGDQGLISGASGTLTARRV